MRIQTTLSRGGVTLCAADETIVATSEIYVSIPGMVRCAATREALAPHMAPRQLGAAIDSICRAASSRYMTWRHHEDDPMRREGMSIHWAPDAVRQWKEEERWLPAGSTTLHVEVMTNAAATLDLPFAA